MPPRLELRPPRTHDEALAYSWCFFHSLVGLAQPTQDHVEAFLDRMRASRIRVAVRGGEVLGGLVLLDFGQFFGGQCVPMTGVSAVAVAPQHRSRGVGRALMESALQEMHRGGVALSALYPATQPVYRRLGWEIAGQRQQWRIRTAALALREKAPDVRPMLTEDRAAVQDCYHAWASRRSGPLDRTEWSWRRVLESPDTTVRAYVVDAPGGRGIEGYVVTTRKPIEPINSDLLVRDLVALTPRAQRRLLSFLGDHRSIAPSTLLWLGPGDATFALTEEQDRKLEFEFRWMLRIVNLEGAMKARGFPRGLDCAVRADVADPALPANARRWELGCRDGVGWARPVARGKAAVEIDVRGLAALYSGHSSAHDVALMGLASGRADALDELGSLFAGPAPWTPDMW